jgi:hypothetical protein
MTLPTGRNLEHPPQFFPSDPALPLERELKTQQATYAQGLPGGPPAVASCSPIAPPDPASKAPPLRTPTEVRFGNPAGMHISCCPCVPVGQMVDPPARLEVPGRLHFLQAQVYWLHLSNIRGRPGLELDPTLEVVPANARTASFLEHTAVVLSFTDADFEQVTSGNYLVKVIYLPNAKPGEAAAKRTREIVSTRLEPGVDPIKAALTRGSILAVLRMGNIDPEAPNAGLMNAPSPCMPKQMPAASVLPAVPAAQEKPTPVPAKKGHSGNADGESRHKLLKYRQTSHGIEWYLEEAKQ